MNKAILVLDMPKNCEECPVRSSIGYGKWCIGFDDTYIKSYLTKPNWCPLKEVPERQLIWTDEDEYWLGYNSCLDEILGVED